MITPELERAGQVEVPFQGAFFLGDGFPMALSWLKEKCPLRGVRSLIIPKIHMCGIRSNNALPIGVGPPRWQPAYAATFHLHWIVRAEG
jgi:hypothetical protein